MATVYINHPSDFDRELARFQMLCRKEGILRECRARMHFASASEKNRQQTTERLAKQKKNAQRYAAR